MSIFLPAWSTPKMLCFQTVNGAALLGGASIVIRVINKISFSILIQILDLKVDFSMKWLTSEEVALKLNFNFWFSIFSKNFTQSIDFLSLGFRQTGRMLFFMRFFISSMLFSEYRLVIHIDLVFKTYSFQLGLGDKNVQLLIPLGSRFLVKIITLHRYWFRFQRFAKLLRFYAVFLIKKLLKIAKKNMKFLRSKEF